MPEFKVNQLYIDSDFVNTDGTIPEDCEEHVFRVIFIGSRFVVTKDCNTGWEDIIELDDNDKTEYLPVVFLPEKTIVIIYYLDHNGNQAYIQTIYAFTTDINEIKEKYKHRDYKIYNIEFKKLGGYYCVK